jgi:hypothetical protein
MSEEPLEFVEIRDEEEEQLRDIGEAEPNEEDQQMREEGDETI